MTVTLNQDEALLLAAAGHARLAPSVHNTQPWSFHLRNGAMELHSDPARALGTLDPTGREMTMSCGAALAQLRIALAAQGAECEVFAFPDPSRPHVVAEVQITGHREPDREAIAFDALTEVRQTNRRAFRGHVPAEDIEVLRTVARRYGCELQPVTSESDRALLSVWQQAADAAQVSNPAYRRELRTWVGSDRTNDGIPLAGTVEPDRPTHDLAARDFALAGGGAIPEGSDDPTTPLFLLVTTADDRVSWLAAGEATAVVWLEATRRGLAVQPLSQSAEHPTIRMHLRRDLRLLGMWPQLLLRVGYARPQPRTPRRPVAEVVRVEAGPTEAVG